MYVAVLDFEKTNVGKFWVLPLRRKDKLASIEI